MILEVNLTRRQSTRTSFLLLLFFILGLNGYSAKLFDKSTKKQLTLYLDEICQWIMTSDLDKIAKADGADEWIQATQGDLTRALIVGFELTKNHPEYLDKALQWCDHFASQLKPIITFQGSEAGFWESERSKGTIDIPASNKAALTLARICVYADSGRKKNYQQVLERYAKFIIEGSKEDLQGTKRNVNQGWIFREGENKGALGCSNCQSEMLSKPSTIATATGAAFFAHLYAITHNRQYHDIAAEAIDWILKNRKPNGEIPNLPETENSEERPITMVATCTQAILAGYYLLDDMSLNERAGKEMENTVRQTMRVQNDGGLWGEGADQQGSPGAASLLSWYFLAGTSDQAIPQSLDKFWQTLLNPVHRQSFGVLMKANSTSQMGLATAEMIKPGIVFKKY